jgi:hypothetical protein
MILNILNSYGGIIMKKNLVFKDKNIGTILVFSIVLLLIAPNTLAYMNKYDFEKTTVFTQNGDGEKSWGWWWPDFPGRYEPFFTAIDIYDFDQSASVSSPADFNNDGLLDFAVSWATEPFDYSSISIFYNNENGDFTNEEVFRLESTYINDIDADDYDNDGDIDLLYTYSEYVWYHNLPYNINGTGKLLLNNGQNDFTVETNVFWHGPGDPVNREFNRINPQIACADFDNDGDSDFLVGDNSGYVSYYANDGNGDFNLVCDSDFGFPLGISWGIASADFDGDGNIDFIVTEKKASLEGYIYLKYNDGSNSCFNHSNYKIIAYLPAGQYDSFFAGGPDVSGSLCPIDYNNDNRMDFLQGDGTGAVHLYMQTISGTFEQFTVCRLPKDNDGLGGFISDDLRAGGIGVGDLNGDGLDDAIIAGVKGVVRVFYNSCVLVDIVFPDRACVIKNNEIRSWILPIYSFLEQGTSIVSGDLGVVAKELEPLSKVEFYLDKKLVFTDEESPFEWEWNTFSFGKHTIKAVAYDLEGIESGYDEAKIWKFP